MKIIGTVPDYLGFQTGSVYKLFLIIFLATKSWSRPLKTCISLNKTMCLSLSHWSFPNLEIFENSLAQKHDLNRISSLDSWKRLCVQILVPDLLQILRTWWKPKNRWILEASVSTNFSSYQTIYLEKIYFNPLFLRQIYMIWIYYSFTFTDADG